MSTPIILISVLFGFPWPALFKVWMAQDKDRDPLKKRRDASQAKVVVQLVQDYLPQLSFGDIKVFSAEVRKTLISPMP